MNKSIQKDDQKNVHLCYYNITFDLQIYCYFQRNNTIIVGREILLCDTSTWVICTKLLIMFKNQIWLSVENIILYEYLYANRIFISLSLEDLK